MGFSAVMKVCQQCKGFFPTNRTSKCLCCNKTFCHGCMDKQMMICDKCKHALIHESSLDSDSSPMIPKGKLSKVVKKVKKKVKPTQ